MVGTGLLQDNTAQGLARRLGVRKAELQGFLIMDAMAFVRALVKVLQGKGFTVLSSCDKGSLWDQDKPCHPVILPFYHALTCQTNIARRP